MACGKHPHPGGRPAKPREHGTERGFHQHHHYGEDPCEGCKYAHSRNQRTRDRRQRKKGRLDG